MRSEQQDYTVVRRWGYMAKSITRAGLLGFTLLAVMPTSASAQTESILVTPEVPPGFDKGRNVGVTERARPDYDALGVPLGQFNVFPQLRVGAGYTSNVLPNSPEKDSDEFVVVSPSVLIVSDWTRHLVSLGAGLDATRYLSTTNRNQNEWNVFARGRYDFSEGTLIEGNAQVERRFETPFSGAIASDLSVLSSYVRSYGAIRGDYQMGQGRAMVSADLTHFTFSSIERSGTTLDQSDRDRSIGRLTAQGEYALTPSTSVFARVGYDRNSYDRDLLNGLPNRDANGYRASVGVNVDLSSLLRGTVSVGYLTRDYDASIYKNVSGFAAEAELEYFYSELTNFTIDASRTIQDTTLGGIGAYFDNRVSARVDHELLRNLLLNAGLAYTYQTYVYTDAKNRVFGATAGARYLATRLYSLETDLSYTKRNETGRVNGRNFNEFRALFSVTLHP
jgi:hypothetical protein